MSNKDQLMVHMHSKSPVAEAYRVLRTNILFSKSNNELRTIMFTSAGPGEGKSTMVANTAVALAQYGKKVIIVDCDLRKPSQHYIFNKKNYGLTNLLIKNESISDLIQDTEVDNVRLLTSGPIPPNPSELLGTNKMQEIISALGSLADYIFIDTPPVIAVTDACVLASKFDGVILVLDSGKVRPEMAQQAKESLLNANGHLLGVVLNRVDLEREPYYYYYADGKQA